MSKSTGGRFKSVALFVGEPILIDDAVAEWFEASTGRAWSPEVLDIIRPPEDRLSSVIATVSQAGLFGTRSGAWIKGIRNEPQDDIDEFLAFAESGLPTDAVIAASCKSLDKRGRLYKWFDKHASIRDLRLATERNGRLRKEEIASLVAERAMKHGVAKPSTAVVQAICARAGTEVGPLVQEIDKLCMGADRGGLTKTQVEQVMTDQAGAWVFDLTDAMGARDGARAQRIIDSLIDQGQAPLALIGLLATRVALLLEARRALAELPSPPALDSADAFLKRSMGAMPGWVQARFPSNYYSYIVFRDAARFGEDELRQLHAMLLRLDLALKSSPLPADSGLSEVVQRACAAPQRPSLY